MFALSSRSSGLLCSALVSCFVICYSGPVLAFRRFDSPSPTNTLTVTNTADSGPGSLRQAILDANALPGGLPVTIAFNIPTTDPNFLDDDSFLTGGDAAADAFFIRPATPLPALTRAFVTIDGRTQTGFTGDTNPFGPEIVIDGRGAVSGAGLTLNAN